MASARESDQVMVFAYRLLADLGLDAVFNEESVRAALVSGYSPLVGQASRSLPEFPIAIRKLSVDAWTAVWTHADEEAITEVLRIARAKGASWNLMYAVLELVRRGGIGGDRDRLLLRVFAADMRVNPWEWLAPKELAVLMALRLGLTVEEPEVWSGLVKTLSVHSLLTLLVDTADEEPLVTEAAVELLGPVMLERVSGSLAEIAVTALLATRDRALIQFGMTLLRRDNGIEFVTGWIGQAELDEADRAVILAMLMEQVDEADKATLITALMESSWSLPMEAQVSLLLDPAFGPRRVWELLSVDHDERLSEIVMASPELLVAIGDSLAVSDIQSMPQHLAMLVLAYARRSPERRSADLPFALALASYPATEVQQFATDRIAEAGLLPNCWLQLAEIGLPHPGLVARTWLQSLPDGEELTTAVIVCLDSPVKTCQDLGVELLGARSSAIDLTRVWNALAETRQSAVQRLVASSELVGSMDSDRLAAFDRRVLLARRVNRAAKRLVQSRLDSGEASLLAHPDRTSAMVELARGRNSRDREWALRSLARLFDAGHRIEGVVVDGEGVA